MSSQNYKTPAIVIKRRHLGEADRIVTVLSPVYGKFNFVARGSRRLKSRLAGAIEPFSISQLNLVRGRSLDILTGAVMERHFGRLGADLERLEAGYLVLELIDRLILEDHSSSAVYELAKQMLGALDEGESPALVGMNFRLNLLKLLGYEPRLDSCIVCGQTSGSDNYFSFDHGGLVDAACVAPVDLPLSVNLIKLWRLSLVASWDSLLKVRQVDQYLAEGEPILDRVYEYQFNVRFRAAGIVAALRV